MYRISIEMPEGYLTHVDYLLNWAEDFEDVGIFLGADLETADLRLVHHDIALSRIADGGDREQGPLIVFERADQAGIQMSAAARRMMAHERVRYWLKWNAFRDFDLNNQPHVAGYWHYARLLDYPALGLDALSAAEIRAEICEVPIDAALYAKVRLLPVLPATRFERLVARPAVPPPSERRVDVGFAGQVDYMDGSEFLARHRHAAVQRIVDLKRLRTFAGKNGGVPYDIYMELLRQTKISVSPWGYGEFSWRDYESILCGAVLVKPDTDYVRTFAPDLYQSGRYYVPCRPDFADLPDVVARILADYPAHYEMTLRARADLLRANSRDAVVGYFVDLFDSIRFSETDPARLKAIQASNMVSVAANFMRERDRCAQIVDLRTSPTYPIRCSVRRLDDDPLARNGEHPIRIVEDSSADNTHDIRLSGQMGSGAHELVALLRPCERRRACLIVHENWRDQFRLVVDLDSLQAYVTDQRGDTFKTGSVRCRRFGSDWRFVKLKLTIARDIAVGISLGPVNERGLLFYDGDGASGIDLGALSLYRCQDAAGRSRAARA